MHHRKRFASVIQGKAGHEEIIATTSFCEDYVIVKNMREAEYVADYIANGGDGEAFIDKFKNVMSKGFDNI